MSIRHWFHGGVWSIALCSVGFAQQAVKLDIDAQPLDRALNTWATQTGYQVLIPSDRAARGRISPVVKGRYTPEGALKVLLASSDLKYEFVNTRTVTIRPTSDESKANAATGDGREKTVPLALAQSRPREDEAAARTTPPSSTSESEPVVDEVLVTAQKRVERLVDVPQSMSVISADSLARQGATQFRDFANTVPGLTYQTAGAGQTQIAMRGVTTGRDVSPTVGVYVDDVPYGSSSAFAQGSRQALDAGLFDLERVEVLRGPQGTLYGASTMGGLLKYVTRLPDTQHFRSNVQAGFSGTQDGRPGYNVAAAVNAPIAADKVALRASAFQSHDGGYVNNVARGESDANSSDIYGGRADLLIAPSSAFQIRLVGFLQNLSRDGEGTVDYNHSGSPVYGELSQQRPLDEPFDQKFRLGSATIDFDTKAGQLTSISSYQNVETDALFDVSAVYVPLLASLGRTYSAVRVPFLTSTEKIAQEIRFSTPAKQVLEGLVGAFYTRERSTNNQIFQLRDASGQPATNDLFTFSLPSRLEEYAAFGNLTWNISNRFDVSGGIRYAHNEQQFQQIGTGTLGRSYPRTDSSEDVATYLANARYHVSENATGYIRFATGYRPGGPNFVTLNPATGTLIGEPTYAADHLKSYEVGFKTGAPNGVLQLDAAAYFIDWSNVQISVNRGGFGAIANAPGGAESRGAELSVTLRPISAFALSGAFAYQDAQMSNADPLSGAAKGERMPNVPRFTASVNADYKMPFWESVQPTLGASVTRVGERTVGFKSQASTYYILPEYTSVDLRAGISVKQSTVRLYARNLFDERGQVSIMFPQFGGRVAVLQPRTIGLVVTTEF